MSGHATYFSSIFSSSLCLLISRWGQHLIVGAPHASKYPQHLAWNRDGILGKHQVGAKISPLKS